MVSDSGCDERCGAAADDGADKRPSEDMADGLRRQMSDMICHRASPRIPLMQWSSRMSLANSGNLASHALA
jgi:hypothetical protein